ncbi:MAG: ATPase [Clostridiales bacterium]|jgi:sugar (pentulose or hexulose) kinase|nr:ATPase [Clostridiales bacterium]
MNIKENIAEGRTYLGIELGSTRIKAVLIGEDYAPIASGGHAWENAFENGIWTYSLDDVWRGMQEAYAALANEVFEKYGVPITNIGAIGISAMMHGYLAFDSNENLLTPFRTWRNTKQEDAARRLTEAFNFNIPQRWSIAHLYQAILNEESHIRQISFITTLAGYVHYKLTGKKVAGIGEASGMFPIDSARLDYNAQMAAKFNEIIKPLSLGWKLEDVLPKVLTAGEIAGVLTEGGAALLDPSGKLAAGIPLCPPEGDAGTGMAATNSVAARTGNVSAGTSVFAMVVLENELSKVYEEIDMVTTPSGKPVAMVHCNNCTSDIDAWINLFGEAARLLGAKADKNELYAKMYAAAAEGCADSMLAYNYFSGEPITKFENGAPLFARAPGGKFTVANVMKTQLFSALATLKIGMDILTENESVKLDTLLGHGGFFKTAGTGQKAMASALNVPVTVMESAGEGGAWGIALLAAFAVHVANAANAADKGASLESFLASNVFASALGQTVTPYENDSREFAGFMKRYIKGLDSYKRITEVLADE